MKGTKSIDLDASVVGFTTKKAFEECCFYGKTNIFNGAVTHSGDNQSGAGEGDDETILVNLTAIPAHIGYLCIIVNSYSGDSFTGIANAYVRLLDEQDQETHRYPLTSCGDGTGYIMATLFRDSNHAGGFSIKAHGELANGKTYKVMQPKMEELIAKIKM